MKLSVLLLSIVVIVGLLISNIFFVNRTEEAIKSEELYKMKFETLQGDVDILTYDLITSRDSVRILNKELESCKSKGLTTVE
jgi:hypothetical protein